MIKKLKIENLITIFIIFNATYYFKATDENDLQLLIHVLDKLKISTSTSSK